ncbi:MAG: YihY/virulence factor BrkB family protein [Opitutales bacterium]|nr:YihY/virulence factor BrkB family protein [Opitutales bacterium]
MHSVAKRHARLILEAGKNWAGDRAFQHSAALAFYMLFSMAPLLIIAITVTGLFLGEEAAQGQLVGTLEQWMGPEGAAALETTIAETHPSQSGWLATIIGFSLLALGATTVFGQLQMSLNDIWKVTPNPRKSGMLLLLKTRFLSLTLVLTIGFLLLVSLMLTAILSAVVRFANDLIPLPGMMLKITDIVVSLFIISVLFAAIFKVLPDVILPWREALTGAFITAVLFIFGKYVISLYITYTGAASAYGAAGSLVAVLIWINYSALILFFGVQVTKVYAMDRGVPIEPKATAVRVCQQIVQESPANKEKPHANV